MYIHILDSAVGLDIRGPNNSSLDMKRWNTYTGDLFIVVKVCVEPVTLLG